MEKRKCVKCKREFQTTTIFIKDSRTYCLKSDNESKLFCNLRTRVKSKKCQLCNNMDKAFSYVNNLM